MALLRVLPLAAVVALGGCAQTLSFEQCNADSDCAALAGDGGTLYCTTDHLCVAGVPNDRICSDVIGADVMGPHLVVGVLYNQSDDADKLIADAARLAFTQMNQLGAAASQPAIEAHFCDTENDPVQAVKAAKKAVEGFGAVALVGPTTSDEVIAINPYVVQKGVLVISPSATAVDITSLQDQGLVWRTAPSDALQANLLAQTVATATKNMMGQPVVDEMHSSMVYGSSLSAAFQTEYAQQAGLGFHKGFPYTLQSDIKSVVNSIAADSPTQVVAIVPQQDAPEVVKEIAAQPGLSTQQIFFTDAAMTTTLFGPDGSNDPNVLNRVRGTGPALPSGTAYTLFHQQFIGMFTTDPNGTSWVANAYDAAYLVGIAAAATQGHVPTGKDLANGLGRIKVSGTAVQINSSGGYVMALQQMQSGGVRLTGASGPLEFDSSGDPTQGTYDLWCINTTGSTPRFSTVDMTGACP